MRRRAIATAVALTAVLFLALAIPGSPLTTWVVDLIAGHRGAEIGIVERSEPPPARSREALRVAIGAMISPQRTFHDYRELFAMVASLAGEELELLQRRSYGEVNDLVTAGEVDLAWVCTGAVEELADRRAARLVAVPVVGGETRYRSYLVVPEAESVDGIEDLRGTVFAFTDPLSLTGRRVVVSTLGALGETPESFFAHTFYTHAHDRSIDAVRDGLAAGACVDSLVFDHLARSSPEEVAGVRIAWRSASFPIPPLVAPSTLPAERVSRLRALLVSLGDRPDASDLLSRIGIDRFEPGEARLYFPQ